MRNTDNRLIWEAYNRFNEAGRRDFLKQSIGTLMGVLTSSSTIGKVATTLTKLPALHYDISDSIEILADIRADEMAHAAGIGSKGYDEFYQPNFKKIKDGILAAFQNNTIDKKTVMELVSMGPKLRTLIQPKLIKIANTSINIADSNMTGGSSDLTSISSKLKNEILKKFNDDDFIGDLGYDIEFANMFPAGPIYLDGNLIKSQVDIIKQKLMTPPLEAYKNLTSFVNNEFQEVLSTMLNPGQYKPTSNDAENDAENDAIKYYPADYKGGIDPENPKLALDSYKKH